MRNLPADQDEIILPSNTPDRTARRIREALVFCRKNNLTDYAKLSDTFIVRAEPHRVRIHRRVGVAIIPNQVGQVSVQATNEIMEAAKRTSSIKVSSFAEIAVHVTQNTQIDRFVFTWGGIHYQDVAEGLRKWCERMNLTLNDSESILNNGTFTITRNDNDPSRTDSPVP